MKVSLFEQVPYRYMPEGFENQHNSVVTAPYQVVEPAQMAESIVSAYAELMGGARAGLRRDLRDRAQPARPPG